MNAETRRRRDKKEERSVAAEVASRRVRLGGRGFVERRNRKRVRQGGPYERHLPRNFRRDDRGSVPQFFWLAATRSEALGVIREIPAKATPTLRCASRLTNAGSQRPARCDPTFPPSLCPSLPPSPASSPRLGVPILLVGRRRSYFFPAGAVVGAASVAGSASDASLSLGVNFNDSELTQNRNPVGRGPSSKTWPRWQSHRAHRISVRIP